ncbi:MAG: hypothetical protein EZS28_025743, partial [Streblomastix strix]
MTIEQVLKSDELTEVQKCEKLNEIKTQLENTNNLQLSPQETLASPLYFEIAKWAAGTGCSVELPIPMGRP